MSDDTNIVSWQVDGKRYDVDLYDIDGIEWRDITRVTGQTQTAAMRDALLFKEFGAIAAFLWIMRRRSEPGLKYDDVLRGLTYLTLRNTAGGSVNALPTEDDQAEEQPPNPPV